MNAVKKYQTFHGKPPRRVKRLDFHVPKQLIVLGKAVAVEYECDKLNGGGDGKKAVYRHEFEKPAFLCMDESGRKQLYIVGNRVSVTQRGIIN